MTEPPTAAELDELITIGPATLHEAQAQKGTMDCGIKPLDPESRMIGLALPVEVKPGDILPIITALAQAKRGEVIVVDGKGFEEVALAGELMAHQALRSGLAGMVLDGAVRDAADIVRLRFPIFCRTVTMKGPTYRLEGTIGEPVMCGGVRVARGDLVAGDRDGVVVIAREHWRTVQAAARERDAKEARIRAGIKEGRTLMEMLGL